MATMKDREFLAEAKTAKLDLNPLTGHEVEKIVHGFFSIQPAVAAKLHDIVVSKN